MSTEHDEVDRIVGAWGAQRPDLDFSPLEVLSRVDRLSRHLDRARRERFVAATSNPGSGTCCRHCDGPASPTSSVPSSCCEQTLVSSGTMTNRIDRLVGRRLVRREADPGDGRSVLVTITDEGKTRVDAAITPRRRRPCCSACCHAPIASDSRACCESCRWASTPDSRLSR
jgi:hypothetical protein